MDYKTLAAPETVQKTMQAVEARGINVVLVDNKAEALAKLKSLIPAGAPVITASSQTLTEIGLDDIFISGEHPWINLKTEILAEKDPVKQTLLRKQATLADYYLGSARQCPAAPGSARQRPAVPGSARQCPAAPGSAVALPGSA